MSMLSVEGQGVPPSHNLSLAFHEPRSGIAAEAQIWIEYEEKVPWRCKQLGDKLAYETGFSEEVEFESGSTGLK